MLFHKIQGAGGAGGAVLEPLYMGVRESTSASSITQTNADISVPNANRVVVVVTIGRSTNTNSVTIGGNAATKIAATEATGTNRQQSIWYLAVPTGTTATITANFGVTTNPSFFWYVLYPSSSTPLDAGKNEGNTSALTVSNIAKTSGGFVIAGVSQNQSSGSISLSGTGVETIIENYDDNNSGHQRATYSFKVTETTTTDDYTASFNTSSNSSLAIASWA